LAQRRGGETNQTFNRGRIKAGSRTGGASA
jgi:hypothetical protein